MTFSLHMHVFPVLNASTKDRLDFRHAQYLQNLSALIQAAVVQLSPEMSEVWDLISSHTNTNVRSNLNVKFSGTFFISFPSFCLSKSD